MRENRNYPRANAVLPVRVTYREKHSTIGTEGSLNDFSNGGVGLILSHRLPTTLPTASLCISLGPTHQVLELDVRVVWLRPMQGDSSFRCGFQFVNVTDEQLQQLKDAIRPDDTFIKGCIQHIVETTRDSELKDSITRFFVNEVKSYITNIAAAFENAQDGAVATERAKKQINEFSNNIVLSGNRLEDVVQDKLTALEIRKAFRLLLGPWIYQSHLMKHGFEKPKGYPGDHALLEHIYDNRLTSRPGSLGMYFDNYFLGNAYAESVRKRKDKTLDLLRRYLEGATSKLAVLNLACGSCREIRDLMAENTKYADQLQLTALDQDVDALRFSEQALRSVAPALSVRFVQEDILNLIRDPKGFAKNLGSQDVIYSIGLADYLPDRVLKKLVKFCMGILRPGGRFIIAHKDQERDKQAPLPPEWFCDWHFCERSEAKLINLVQEVTTCPITIERDASERIFFLIVTPPET